MVTNGYSSLNSVDSGWIPFEFVGPNAPIVCIAARINSRHVIRMTLDTGNASGIHISEEAAHRLSLNFENAVDVPDDSCSVGADFVPSAYQTEVGQIQIGNWELGCTPVTISNYVDHLARSVDAAWEANMGYEVFAQTCITVDYPNSRVQFSDNCPAEVPMSPLQLGEYPWIIVSAQVNGSEEQNFILDTGAGGTLIESEFADHIGLELGDEVDMIGATGTARAHYARGVTLSIGDRAVEGLDVVVSSVLAPMSEAAGIRLAGVVGYDFLRNGIVCIDYKRKQIGYL